jgi:hypothetical protein
MAEGAALSALKGIGRSGQASRRTHSAFTKAKAIAAGGIGRD